MSQNKSFAPPPTIITAFYKLDLATQSTKSYKAKRTTQTYLEYFSFLSKLQNNFIIYTNEDIDSEIYAMRSLCGLESKTIIIHKDLESFDTKALDSIRKVFKDYNQAADRFDPEHPPHTSPEYNYLMYCKSFFVCDALHNPLTKPYLNEQILWLDFGYNFNGAMFVDSNEFDFILIPQAPLIDSKINLFCLGRKDNRALPHILLKGSENFLIGGCLYGSKEAWISFNECMQKALQAFVSFNIMDDDQKLYIWCVRNFPDIFNILYIDDWFNALFYFMEESKRKSVSTTKDSILRDSLLTFEQYQNQCQNIENTESSQKIAKKRNISRKIIDKIQNKIKKISKMKK